MPFGGELVIQLGLETNDANTAIITPDGVYRYWLSRELGGDRPLVICGLNPSVADARKDDPTIRKDIGFAKRWGCGRVIKVNAEAFRATDPAVLKRARKSGVNTIGPENDEYIRRAFGLAWLTNGIPLVAWGNHITEQRQRDISFLLRMLGVTPVCLGTNKNGSPVHELYQPYERELVPWVCP